jgi:hypothetical protein
MANFIEEKSIYVSQPYSDFYVASIPVGKLVVTIHPRAIDDGLR